MWPGGKGCRGGQGGPGGPGGPDGLGDQVCRCIWSTWSKQ